VILASQVPQLLSIGPERVHHLFVEHRMLLNLPLIIKKIAIVLAWLSIQYHTIFL
jgi:hypothetical protein